MFLDEIGDLPMTIQVKLLRVLEQREVLRVGARAPRPVDVRFVSATHRDLESASTAGSFRQDLYFRLNGISLTIPPLRERPADLPWLVKRFLVTASRQMDRSPHPTLSPKVLAALQAYPWPGNVRELRNVVERAVVLAPGDVILPEHLPAKILAASEGRGPAASEGRGPAASEGRSPPHHAGRRRPPRAHAGLRIPPSDATERLRRRGRRRGEAAHPRRARPVRRQPDARRGDAGHLPPHAHQPHRGVRPPAPPQALTRSLSCRSRSPRARRGRCPW